MRLSRCVLLLIALSLALSPARAAKPAAKPAAKADKSRRTKAAAAGTRTKPRNPYRVRGGPEGPNLLDLRRGGELGRARRAKLRHRRNLARGRKVKPRVPPETRIGRSVDEFIAQMNRDTFIKALDKKVDLRSWAMRAVAGEPIDVGELKAVSRAAADEYVQNDIIWYDRVEKTISYLGARDREHAIDLLVDKYESIGLALVEASRTARRPRPRGTRGRKGDVDGPLNGLAEVYDGDDSTPVEIEAVPGARATRVSARLPGRSRAERMALATELYGVGLVPQGRRARGPTRRALSWRDTGRAVATETTNLEPGSQVETEDLIKGLGSTSYAGWGNRINPLSDDGAVTLQEAEDDFDTSTQLLERGFSVYHPIAVVRLPYMTFEYGAGWTAMANYVRRPESNFRISDALAPGARGRVPRLRAHIRKTVNALLADAGSDRQVTESDAIRFIVLRLGRQAGLMSRERFVHGQLHEQNVGLLGEMVDLGHVGGFMASDEQVAAAWAKNDNYERLMTKGYLAQVDGPSPANPRAGEAGILHHWASSLNRALRGNRGRQALGQAELDRLFDSGFQQGRRGRSAADVVDLMSGVHGARATRSASSAEH